MPEVNITEGPFKRAKTKVEISLTDEDLEGIHTPHDDAVVVVLQIANCEVKRVLVDNGSSTNILYYDAFEKMGLPLDKLKKMDSPLYGFSEAPVKIECAIELVVTAGSGD